jgi:hypothetical protein
LTGGFWKTISENSNRPQAKVAARGANADGHLKMAVFG